MLKKTLHEDSITYLKASERMKVITLRNVLGEITTREKSGKTPIEMDDQAVEALLRKEVARRRETAATYHNAGHGHRADRENEEADFLETYLPSMLSASEAAQAVDSVFEELGDDLTLKDMGRAMKAVNEQVAGRFDGKELSLMVRSRLAA